MSWWVGVHVDTGGLEPLTVDDRNVTYNLGPMLTLALGVPFRSLAEAPCTEAGGVIAAAADRMRADPGRFEAVNPPNGWGDYAGCVEMLEWLAGLCAAHPKGSVYVH